MRDAVLPGNKYLQAYASGSIHAVGLSRHRFAVQLDRHVLKNMRRHRPGLDIQLMPTGGNGKRLPPANILDDDVRVKSAIMKHSETDQVSLELGRRVAERLRWQPELVAFARANLARWSRQNTSAPSLLRCYAEWQKILSRPVDEICDLLCAETDNAQRLRQNSPFAGVLPPAEVWEVKSRFHHAPATD